ncbi:hypothetical protein JTB14_002640 [Gonioctena quinquepunctata]|nr:hypothetical protein JTB14_002640 [Gonioctena quinquepunctata]
MWQKSVRKWGIDNDAIEITEAYVPKILKGLIEGRAMPKNIVSGFRATGHIEPAILPPFKEAKAENYDWDSNTEATMLFDFWLRVSNETGESNKENATNSFHDTANSSVIVQSQPEVTINQQSTPGTHKAITSKDDLDHSNVDVHPSKSV